MQNRAAETQSRAAAALICSVALAGLPCAAARGAEAHAPLRVSVMVAPRVSLAVQAPGQLTITASDIARGRVEVSDPTQLGIESNGPNGVLLDLVAPGGLFTDIDLIAADGTTHMPGEGGVVTLRWPTPTSQGRIELSWKWRFHLRPGVAAGTYTWPVRIHAQPLDPVLAVNRR